MEVISPVLSLTALDLLGQVAVEHLRQHLRQHNRTATARFILDRLTPEQMASIAHSVLNDEELRDQFEIKLPERFLAGTGLPPHVLTQERATFHRNQKVARTAQLLANTGDDEAQSLELITPVGAVQLLQDPSLWIDIAAEGLPISPTAQEHWGRALAGLRDLNSHALERLAQYVVATRDAVGPTGPGLALVKALGYALPALHMPRSSTYFETLAEKLRSRPSEWRKLYEKIERQRAPFLRKQTPAQTLLSDTDLRASFDRVRGTAPGCIPEALQPLVEAFIEEEDDWGPATQALALAEWEDIEPLFSGLKRERSNLGKNTADFYEDNNPEALTLEDREYLKRLSKRPTQPATDEDHTFHDVHRLEFEAERRLKVQWDRFLHGAPLETEDFLAGLALRLERLFVDENTVERRLRIRLENRKRQHLRELNAGAGLYFATRYRGLPAALGAGIEWEVGELFDYPALLAGWAAKAKGRRAVSKAKTAMQLKFTILLEAKAPTGGKLNYSTQLIWKFDPRKVSAEMPADWQLLSEYPMRLCTITRETVSAKGVSQTVDLRNVQTLVPTHDKDRGSFVGEYSPATDVALVWPANLTQRLSQGWLSESTGQRLRAKWAAFEMEYRLAIQGFFQQGFQCPHLLSQAEAYGELLTALCLEAKGGHNRESLLRPLLQLGSVTVEGGAPAEIITPWHPLRLLAMAVKVKRTARLVDRLLRTPDLRLGDNAGRLFFKDLSEELEHPFYPEVVLSWQANHAGLLSLTDTCGDYTLHEPPRVGADEVEETSENPTEGARRVVDLVERYLKLQPHENANLSVVLYNCDSSRLPQAVVNRLGDHSEDIDETRCQVLLFHRDARQLRQLYERIVESADDDPDAFNASEATRDFMARLRISISVDQASAPNSKDGPPHDLVFSQDVISRHAQLEWYLVEASPMDLLQLVPAHWSRRRPVPLDDTKSVVYLCCPVQPVAGWAYLTALATFLKDDWDGVEGLRWLPARQLNFHEPKMRQIFDQTHNLGNWVVNYDELLDRRQLMSQGVQVIRYKQSSTQGRNLIVSSNAPLDLLQSMVRSRIKKLNLGLSAAQEQQLTVQFIGDANSISGDLVLRAAKRGRSASELMGVVLSRFLIEREVQGQVGADTHFGWYFLDDYADWLGQREQQIADILMLNPSRDADGTLRLALVVSEAKYVTFGGLEESAKNSRAQLRDTLRRIHDALFGVPTRMDRESWLARLADMLLDGVQFSANASLELAEWRRAVREGRCAISLRGYSHVFVSGPEDAADCADRMLVVPDLDGYQEIFGFAQVQGLALQYFHNQDPTALRGTLGGPDNPQSPLHFQVPPGLAAAPAVGGSDHPPVPNLATASDNGSPSSLEESPLSPSPLAGGPAVALTPAPESELPAVLKTDSPAGPSAAVPSAQWAFDGIAAVISLRAVTKSADADAAAWLKTTEFTTKSALQGFGLQAKLEKSKLTPNAALLKFQGSAHLTVEQVLRRQTEFKTTYGLSLVSVQPEPGLVALAVERPHRQVVRLEELWARWRPESRNGNHLLVIGVREDDGELLTLSPQQNAPHTLIAGSTGSGKSVLMQNIILGIAATNTPVQARIILIDPKLGVDYFALEPLPHLRGGIIDTQEKALEELESLVTEMDERYRRFKAARTANLAAYNAKMPPAEQLPVIWLIHDEFAEWMMVDEYKKQVTAVVGRLGVKARAAGIYLVFAAQRPEASVMPMQLRANLGNRLILRVDSEGTSEIALGQKGAERLLGKGHLLARLEGESGLVFAQVPFVEEATVEALVQVIAAQDESQGLI